MDCDPFALDQLPKGGLGLEIMREVMDQVDYESGGGVNCLRMTKRIPVAALEA
jgi:anti-sigma regulatory factor (Ser/Thr protein kinase)